MRVVTALRLILNMRRVDRNAALTLLRRLVDRSVVRKRRTARKSKNLRDRSRQRRLAVVNMANRANVRMRLGTLKFFLRHLVSSPGPLAPETGGVCRFLHLRLGPQQFLERVAGIEPA
jgi:hypothetical protein